MRRIFLTGATGFLGGVLAVRLIRKGFALTVLVRDSKTFSGEERLVKTLRGLMDRSEWYLIREHVTFERGHLSDPTLGLEATPGMWDAFVHCAASTDFNEKNHENLKRTNVEGVHSVLRFAKKNEIASFHYVSSSYTCGDVKGRVKEAIQFPSRFRNLYEETKNQAEHICDSFCLENNIRLTIHRPSIIVGDSKTGRTLNFEGPYLFLKQIHRLCHYVRRKLKCEPNQPIELGLKIPTFEEDEQNVVPVDYVADFVSGVLAREPLESKVYHITNPHPPTNGDLNRAMKKLLHFEGFHFTGDVEFMVKGKLETLFANNLKAYWPYLKPRVVFDRTNTEGVEKLIGLECPVFNEALIQKLYAFALETNFGKKSKRTSIESIPSAR